MPIYKCFDKTLGLVYTDVPCKDGERLDIRAGDADPAAVARLERQGDALDQSADERIADQRQIAAVADRMAPLQYGSVEQGWADDDEPTSLGDYGFFSYSPMHPHPRRHRHPKPDASSHFAPLSPFAPSPPFAVPRP